MVLGSPCSTRSHAHTHAASQEALPRPCPGARRHRWPEGESVPLEWPHTPCRFRMLSPGEMKRAHTRRCLSRRTAQPRGRLCPSWSSLVRMRRFFVTLHTYTHTRTCTQRCTCTHAHKGAHALMHAHAPLSIFWFNRSQHTALFASTRMHRITLIFCEASASAHLSTRPTST